MSSSNFPVISKLGEGSFGEVFKVNVPRNKPYYAQHQVAVVKQVSDTYGEAVQEAKLLKYVKLKLVMSPRNINYSFFHLP